jgi:hypothetical protein
MAPRGNTPFNVAVTNISTGNNLVAQLPAPRPCRVKTIEINGNEYPITWTTIFRVAHLCARQPKRATR